ncbi:MAG: tol-pal system protein YbgF [Rhodanobacteraceae bacterium]|nr:MAG: tol-pal system protein YbgF [Rhodanobacteraceae bacterium]
MVESKEAVARAGMPRKVPLIMAASAAMIVAGVCMPVAHAQDAGQAQAPPAGSNGVALVNRIQSLESQMRQMQGQIEVLQHQLDQQKQSSKDQYIDLDSRLRKLEQAQPSAPAASAAASSTAPSTSAKPATSAKPVSAADEAAIQAEYQAAFKSLRAGNYVDSAREFRAFIDKHPDSKLVSNAYYWLGGSYYVTQNYKPALAAFQALLKHYPDSPKAGEAQLRVADCEIGLKDYTAARVVLDAVIKAHPGTSLERRARDKLQDLPAHPGAK